MQYKSEHCTSSRSCNTHIHTEHHRHRHVHTYSYLYNSVKSALHASSQTKHTSISFYIPPTCYPAMSCLVTGHSQSMQQGHCKTTLVGCVAQWSNVGLWPANIPVLRSTCSRWVTAYVGKPSAIGQPTTPSQTFILSGSIDE